MTAGWSLSLSTRSPNVGRPCLAVGALATAILSAIVLLACDVVAPADARPSPARGGVVIVGTPVGETRPITIYLPRRFMDDTLGLQAVSRNVPIDREPALAAATALVAGPDGDERAADFQYPLDHHTRILGVQIEHGTAMIDLDEEIDRVRGRPYSELVYWAIVSTLTEVPGVERVALRRLGMPLLQLGTPPFPVPATASRADVPAWARPRAQPIGSA
jgi:hypothetical protein